MMPQQSRSTSRAGAERTELVLVDTAALMADMIELVASLLESQSELLATVEDMQTELVAVSEKLAAMAGGDIGAASPTQLDQRATLALEHAAAIGTRAAAILGRTDGDRDLGELGPSRCAQDMARVA